MTSLTLAHANTIANAVIAAGHSERLSPLTVAVLDPGGHPIVIQRDDRSEFLRVDIAIGKAWAALGMGVPGRILAERSGAAPAFFNALAAASHGRFVPGAGGVIVRNETDAIVGAVGVSGDSGEADEEAAKAGIQAANLRADWGQETRWHR